MWVTAVIMMPYWMTCSQGTNLTKVQRTVLQKTIERLSAELDTATAHSREMAAELEDKQLQYKARIDGTVEAAQAQTERLESEARGAWAEARTLREQLQTVAAEKVTLRN